MANSDTTTFGEQPARAFDQHRERVADAIDDVANQVEAGASKLGVDTISKITQKSKQKLGAAADYLRESDAADMVEDVKRYAKANPVPMLLGALAIGFLAGRMLRRS